MKHRYSPLKRRLKAFYRQFFPVPVSPWTEGYVKDICEINLVPPEKLVNYFKETVHLLRKEKGENIGDYLEFGVFNGSSMGSMCIAKKESRATSTRLFGFDAFEGLPPDSEKEDAGVWKKGFYSCSFKQMQECLTRRNISPEGILWIKGWYDKTLNAELVQKYNLENFGIVFIDCDTYSSSKTVLDFITPLIKTPLVICLDDWKLNDLDIKELGEYKSFNEFLENNPHLEAKEIKSYNRKSKSFLVRPII